MNVIKYTPFMLAAAMCLAAAAPLQADSAARYEAVFSDGSRLNGERISGWDKHPGSPRLDNVPLLDAKRQLRWLRDRGAGLWSMPADCGGFIEFITGDRIVGQVTGSRLSSAAEGVRTPAHLLVMPVERLDVMLQWQSPPTPVRVLAGSIRRIVMKPTDGVRCQHQPGTLFYRDGRRASFVSVRPGADCLRLLLSNGTLEVKFAEIAEVHFPITDTWEEYFRELGILSPACRSRLMRLETTGGLIATASELRFHALPYPSTEYHQWAASQIQNLEKCVASMERSMEHQRKRFDKVRDDYARQLAEIERRLEAARQARQRTEADIHRAEAQEDDGKVEQLTRKLQSDKYQEEACQERSTRLKATLDRAAVQWKRHSGRIEQATSQRDAAVRVYGGSAIWRHIIQPVWSLDALWVPFGSISMRWSFSPDLVPLSRVHPAASVGPPLQPWSLNRNSGGKLLRSGGREYGWGFGVHAYSELAFALPQCATSFRTGVGLDRIVDTGGCARARVFLGSAGEKPLYVSGLLIGSAKTVDSGSIALGSAAKGPKRLVLQADPAHRDRPSGADPLNIRDKLDWLDPMIGFDPAGLQDAVNRKIAGQKDVWKGWTVKFDKNGDYRWTGRFWKSHSADRGRFLTRIRAGKRPLVLSQTIKVGPDDSWLVVDTGDLASGDAADQAGISLRIDDKEIKPEKRPVRRVWWKKEARPVFSIAQYKGKKVTLELAQPAGDRDVFWHEVSVSSELPVEYRFAMELKRAMALGDSKPLPSRLGQGTVDLLKAVNPDQDSVHGQWTKPEGQLLSDWKVYARCQLSAGSQGDYQLEIQFTRVVGDCLGVMLPVGRTGALLVVSGWEGKVSGLAYVNRKDANGNETTRNGELENGVKHTLLITTRLLDGARARIDVTLDGKPYIKWEGLESALSPDGAWGLRDPKVLGLGAYNAIIVIHSCQFREFKDQAKTVKK